MIDAQTLIDYAREARECAYVPYSHFRVGSALLASDGSVHIGCNVENAAFGPTNCAERTALFRAIADGHQPRSFLAIAVIGETTHPISPCGTCRQVLSELCAADMPVYLANLTGQIQTTTVADLLPDAFSMPVIDSN